MTGKQHRRALLAILATVMVVAGATVGAVALTISTNTVSDPGDTAPVPGGTQVVLDLTMQSDDSIVNDHDGDTATAAEAGDDTGTFGTDARFYDADGSNGYNAGDEVYLDDDGDTWYTSTADVLADGDGDAGTSFGGGSKSNLLTAGGALTEFDSADNVYLCDEDGDGLTSGGNDDRLFFDSDDNGDSSDGASTFIIISEFSGACSVSTQELDSSFPISFDDNDDDGTVNDAYDNSEAIFVEEDTVTDSARDRTYSDAADTIINYGTDDTQTVGANDADSDNDLDENTYGHVDVDDSGDLNLGDEVYTEGDTGTLGSEDYGDDLTDIDVENTGSLPDGDITQVELVTLDSSGDVVSSVATDSSPSSGVWSFTGQTVDFADDRIGVRVTLASGAATGETLEFEATSLSFEQSSDDTSGYANGAAITVNAGGAKVVSVIEAGGTIELAFDRDVTFDTNDAGNAPSDFDKADALTVYVDGEPVGYSGATADPVSAAGSFDLVLDMGDVDPNSEVLIDGQIDDAGGNTIDLDNETVQVTGATVGDASVEAFGSTNTLNTFRGTSVAVNLGSDDVGFELLENGDFVRGGSAGANSNWVVFNSDGRDLTNYTYVADADGDDNFADSENEYAADITVRELGFDAETVDTSLEQGDTIEVDVTANDGGRTVEVVVEDPDGDEVVEGGESVTLNGDGEVTYELDLASDTATGNYSITVTDVKTGIEVTPDDVSVGKSGTGKANFAQSIVTDQRGDIAEFTVTLSDATTANVSVGSEDIGFFANITVEDDGDGEVTVLFDTSSAGDLSEGDSGPSESNGLGQAFSVDTEDEDDEITAGHVDTALTAIPDAGDYELGVGVGDQIDADDIQNVGTLVIEERSTESMALWTASQSTVDDLEDKDDVYAEIESGNITQDSEIAKGDYVVHQVVATGLEGTIEDASGTSATAKFFDVLGNGAELTVNVTNPGPNRAEKVLNLGSDNTTVIADYDNDTYFVVVDTDANAFRDSNENLEFDSSTENDNLALADEDELTANFTVTADALTNNKNDQEVVMADFAIVAAEHAFAQSEDYDVTADENVSIEGTTTVAPGTELTLRVTSIDDTQPRFLKTGSAVVQADGSWSDSFDFSSQNVNDSYRIRVSGGPASAETVEGTVRAAMTETATETETETPTETETDTATATATSTPAETGSPTETATETATATDTATETTEQNTPGFGVALAVVALLAAALLAVRRD